MKNLLIPFLISLFLFSCTDESEMDLMLERNQIHDISDTNFKNSDKVNICHKGKIINVNSNSVLVHQTHGDAVDMDGDGYYDQENECGPVDFDDSNPYITENIALNKRAFASRSWMDHVPATAIDGDHDFGWNAGARPTQWIAIDLLSDYNIEQINLTVDQFPVTGSTIHNIYFSTDGFSWTLVDVLDGVTNANDVLISSPSAQPARYIRVETTVSPSWVAWLEIEVYGSSVE